MATPPAPEKRAANKRQIRAPAKHDDDWGEKDMARAVQASLKHQRRTSSTAVTQCPVFHPTAEEFRDPFAYIKSISSVAAQAGIAKIVPPEGARARRLPAPRVPRPTQALRNTLGGHSFSGLPPFL